MQIDKFAPRYDFREHNSTDVHAPAERVYGAVRALDLRYSSFVRALFRLRGMPEECLTLNGLLKSGFTVLAEVPNKELLLGLVGRFWTISGGVVRLNAEGFYTFGREGYAKAAWNFSLEPRGENVTRLATETRVFCTDDASRRMFRLYWLFIRPFSGSVRREALRAVKRAAEQAQRSEL